MNLFKIQKEKIARIYFLLIFSLLLSGCSLAGNVSNIKNGNISHFEISKPSRPITQRINNTDFKKVFYPIGKYGGALNLTTFGSGPKTFNLWASTDNTSSTLSRLMFDSLFEDDPDTGEVTPHLAKEYQILDGGKTINVKLREGVKWSDGKPVTSDDVVFTWNEIVFTGLEGGGFQSLCLIDGKYPTVRKIDDYTVQFMTHVVFAPFLRQISYPPAPKHIFKPILNKASKPSDKKKVFLSFWGAYAKAENFVTNGPFKLSRYVPGERIEFVKNSNYYVINTENNRLPYFDKLIYTIVQDASLDLFKFLAKETDVISINGDDVELVKELEEKRDFKTVNLGPSSGTEFLVFNLTMGEPNPVSSKWFNNEYFRQAVSHAIDRNSIVASVLGGVGKPLFTPESHASIYLNEKIKDGYPQDLKYAKKLLKKGNFKWNKERGLFDSNGKRIEFTILTNAENSARQTTGVIIQDDLRKLGIKVNLKPIDFNTLIGRSDSGDWEAIILGFTGGFFEPNEGANVWKLDGRLHMFDSKPHKARDWELEIDKAFDQATRVINFKSRKKFYDRFQEIVYEKLPFIYLTSPLRIIAFQNSLGNIRPTIYGGVIHNLESIYRRDDVFN